MVVVGVPVKAFDISFDFTCIQLTCVLGKKEDLVSRIFDGTRFVEADVSGLGGDAGTGR